MEAPMYVTGNHFETRCCLKDVCVARSVLKVRQVITGHWKDRGPMIGKEEGSGRGSHPDNSQPSPHATGPKRAANWLQTVMMGPIPHHATPSQIQNVQNRVARN